MQQGKSGGRKEALLFAATRGGLDERRRVPLGEMEPVAANLEPTFEEVELRAFSRAVRSFDDDERGSELGVRVAEAWFSRLPA